MKKITLLALCLALLLSLSVPAFAFTAALSTQNLAVNGKAVDCEKYNIDGSNYFKLRDLAYLLNGTGSQFDVGYNSEKRLISITTNHAYTAPNGSELVIGADQSDKAAASSQTIMIDGRERGDLTAYNIGGNNFFQLRELGAALGFDVAYDAATRTVLVTSRGAPERITVFSKENFVSSIPYAQLQQYVAQGYATAQQTVAFDTIGTYWQKSGDMILLSDNGKFNKYADVDQPFCEARNGITTAFFLYGSTAASSFVLNDHETLTRVELPDTVTKLNAFSLNSRSITRIGIPASVTAIEDYAINTSAPAPTLYGEAGSYAERYAKEHSIPFVSASILYDPLGRTVMVTPEERELFLGNGWYEAPVRYLYATDGRSKIVPLDQVAANVAVGWFDFHAAQTDRLIVSGGFNAGVTYLEEQLKRNPALEDACRQKLDQTLQNWQITINCPVAILEYKVTQNSSGIPEVSIRFRNLTKQTITGMDVQWTCLDAGGKVTTDYPLLYNGSVSAHSFTDLAPGAASAWRSWTLYSNQKTTQIKDLFVASVTYGDETTWKK